MPKPTCIEYALFDFDGVIADTEPLLMELDRQALAHFGYAASDAELRTFMGHPSDAMAQRLLAAHGIAIERADFTAVRDVSHGIYGNPALEPTPGLGALWARLREKGVRIAVVSSSRAADLLRALNRWGLLSCLDAVVGREHVERLKPDPQLYERALEYLAGSDARGAGAHVGAAHGDGASLAANAETCKAAADLAVGARQTGAGGTETCRTGIGLAAGARSTADCLGPMARNTSTDQGTGARGTAIDLDAVRSRAVAFEDSPTGIAAARAAGVYVFGFTGSSVKQDVSAADAVCASFAELAARL